MLVSRFTLLSLTITRFYDLYDFKVDPGIYTMLTLSSSTDRNGDDVSLVTTQISDLRQLFGEHESILDQKSINIASLTKQIDKLEQDYNYEYVFEHIHSRLANLLECFNDKFGKSIPSQQSADQIENTDRIIASNTLQQGLSTQEMINELQEYIDAKEKYLESLGPRFSDILASTNDLMASIPMDKTNTKNINQLVSLLESCIGTFSA